MRLRDEYYPNVYMTVTPTQGRDAHGKADSRILGLCAQSPLFTPPLLASLSPSLTPTLTNRSPSQRCTRDHRAGGTRLRQGRVCQSSAFCPSSQSQSRIQEDSPNPTADASERCSGSFAEEREPGPLQDQRSAWATISKAPFRKCALGFREV